MAKRESAQNYFSQGKTQIVVDTTWGDGGKGKVVDSAAPFFDIVVRYAGGPNAGHTVIDKGMTYKFHGLPSSILHENTFSVLAAGVVVNPTSFVEEMKETEKKGVKITPEKLLISQDILLIMPWHQYRDSQGEKTRGAKKIGTTGQGIGPAYEDVAGRKGLLMRDLLLKEEELREKFDAELGRQEKLARALTDSTDRVYDGEKIFADLLKARERIKPFIGDASHVLWQAEKEGKRILGEGAQGALLDVLLGGRPYVTSSHPGRGGFEVATAISAIDAVIGVTKAYATRVGEGPMPTELFDKTGDQIREAGGEFGATTGRPRRCGWFDAVAVKLGAKISGTTTLAITKLDILDTLDEIKLCVGYEVNGKVHQEITDPQLMLEAVPIYETLPGWQQSTAAMRRWSELPENALRYIQRIEEVVGLPIEIVSVGPGRDEAMYRRQSRTG